MRKRSAHHLSMDLLDNKNECKSFKTSNTIPKSEQFSSQKSVITRSICPTPMFWSKLPVMVDPDDRKHRYFDFNNSEWYRFLASWSNFAREKGLKSKRSQCLFLFSSVTRHERNGILDQASEILGKPGLRVQNCHQIARNGHRSNTFIRDKRGASDFATEGERILDNQGNLNTLLGTGCKWFNGWKWVRPSWIPIIGLWCTKSKVFESRSNEWTIGRWLQTLHRQGRSGKTKEKARKSASTVQSVPIAAEQPLPLTVFFTLGFNKNEQ